jgi:hypothetical protein
MSYTSLPAKIIGNKKRICISEDEPPVFWNQAHARKEASKCQMKIEYQQ